MNASNIELRRSYHEALELMGMDRSSREICQQVLSELVAFMATPPCQWRRIDLERFLRIKMPVLRPQERHVYGTAMGLLTEIIESTARNRQSIWLDDMPSSRQCSDFSGALLQTSEFADGPSTEQTKLPDETDFLGETLRRLEQRERSGVFPRGGSANTPRPPAPSFVREPSSVGIGAASPFVREPSRPVQAPTAREGSSPRLSASHPQAQLPPAEELADGPSKAERFDRSNSDKWRRAPERVAALIPNAQNAHIDVVFDAAHRTILLTWSGFVLGEQLRWALERGLELQRRHGCFSWLADMRLARVLSQDDTGWFAQWLQDAGSKGVQRFAVVSPDHVICRMQLQRIREATDAFSVTMPNFVRTQTCFFDHLEEAHAWLARA
ncbi:MAG: hypothetical protein RBU37_24230 [Myxococcota bacterium]|jgi:hypothetical protein|nr:hypothetical protein [Myxococcota bacterium]